MAIKDLNNSSATGMSLGSTDSNHRELLEVHDVWMVYGERVQVEVPQGISLIISLLSGLYPAIRASRMDPVQALRSE